MLKVAKSGADGVTKNLFETLAENGRLGLSSDVISQFQNIMAAHRGEVTITITCASARFLSHSRMHVRSLSVELTHVRAFDH